MQKDLKSACVIEGFPDAEVAEGGLGQNPTLRATLAIVGDGKSVGCFPPSRCFASARGCASQRHPRQHPQVEVVSVRGQLLVGRDVSLGFDITVQDRCEFISDRPTEDEEICEQCGQDNFCRDYAAARW